jgi:hypothetical protein
MKSDALQAFLQVLIDNEELRQKMSICSRKRAVSLYSYQVIAKQHEDLSRELSAISSRVTSAKQSKSFDKPSYFCSFANHASHFVEGNSALSVTPFRTEAAGLWLLAALDVPIVGPRVVRGDLIRCALEQFCRGTQETELGALSHTTMLFSDLVKRVGRGRDYHPDYIRRHIMWLLKQGFLAIN